MDAAVAAGRTFTAIGTRWQIDTGVPLAAWVSAEIDAVIVGQVLAASEFADSHLYSPARDRHDCALPQPVAADRTP